MTDPSRIAIRPSNVPIESKPSSLNTVVGRQNAVRKSTPIQILSPLRCSSGHFRRAKGFDHPIFGRSPLARLLTSFLVLFALVLSSDVSVIGQEPSGVEAAQSNSVTKLDSGGEKTDGSESLVVGINGHYRVGRTTAVKLSDKVLTETSDIERSNLVMETLDGDGVRVRFGAYPSLSESDSSAIELAHRELGYIVAGSEAAPLTIRHVSGDSDQVVAQTRLPLQGMPSRGPAMIPPQMPWVISIGDPLGVDSIGASNVLIDKGARIAVTRIESAAVLPFNALGYDGVDLVMINAAGMPVLKAMAASQTDALTNWLRGGGRMVICLGKSTQQMNAVAPWIAEQLPIDEVVITRYDPAALETFTSSQTPLPIFEGIKLPRRVGRTLIAGRTTRRVTAVLAAEYVVGFGHIAVIAADLDRPEFEEWPERLELVTQMTGDLFDEQNGQRGGSDGTTAFGDVAGQMRGVLDQFEIKPTFSFSFLSLIVMLLIAAIGPLDYLLINRVFGKPLLGWLTFPLMVIGLSVFLVYQSAPRISEDTQSEQSATGSQTTFATLRANQFQVTDIDLVDGVGRSFAWAYLYSHDSASFDVEYSDWNTFSSADGQPERAAESFSYPMGYPGQSFGGVQMAGENSAMSAYSIRQEIVTGQVSDGVRSQISALTIAPRSSKSVATKASFVPNLDRNAEVTRRPGSELLRGEFVNPLPVDVLDGMLVYGNWVYLLPTRVPAGASVAKLGDLRQKNFRLRLTHEEYQDQASSEAKPWQPGDFSNQQRVAEMMMFYEAAGGELYTRLRHRDLEHLDLSDLLVDDRCVLVGRTEASVINLSVSDGATDQDEKVTPNGQTVSMIRVVLPVRSTRLN